MSMPAPPLPATSRSSRRYSSLRATRRPTPNLRRNATSNAPRCENPNCSSSDVAEDDGKLICRSCGFVVSDAQITQELTFGEAANGAAVVQGVYVGAGEENARSTGLGPSKITGGMDSRQVTERNGQHAINNLIAALQLSTTQKDRAMRLYKLAMAHNFIQGRKTHEVAAVCLYIACRQDSECRIMLVDFSDLLKRNVFDLGKVYNAFLEELNVNGPVLNLQQVNPENLIQRFAQDLEFGADEHRIANEAVHILKRLDRDWITPGRRPAGVCAAAIILAARMNNYRRTVREVVYTAKVADITIHKRLDEFRYTDSSKLTVDEFRNHAETLSKLHDPPSFYQQFEPKRKRRKTQKDADEEEEEGGGEEGNSVAAEEEAEAETGAPNNAGSNNASASTRQARAGTVPIDPALYAEVSDEHISALAEAEQPEREHEPAENSGENETETGENEENNTNQPKQRGRKKGTKNKPLPVLAESDVRDQMELEKEVERFLQDPSTEQQAAETHRDLNVETQDPRDREQGSAPQTSGEKQGATRRSPLDLDSERISESEFDDDPEVMYVELSDAEKRIKEKIWVHENGDHLRLEQARRIKHELAIAAGTARVPKKRMRRKHHRMGDLTPYQTVDEHGRSIAPSSPAESTKRMLDNRGFSTRLNYSKIDLLFGKPKPAPASAATSTRATSEISETTALSPQPAVGVGSKRSASQATRAIEAPTAPANRSRAVEPIVVDDDEDESDVESIGADYDDDEEDESDVEDEEAEQN